MMSRFMDQRRKMKYQRTEPDQQVVHSPSMCHFQGRVYLTFYECAREGWSQRVVLLRKDKNGDWELMSKFDHGTGNPVLTVAGGKLWLFMSRFHSSGKRVRRCTTLWREYCHTHVYQIITDEDAPIPAIHQILQGMIPRSNGVKYDDTTVVPLYDEALFTGNNYKYDTDKGRWLRHSIIADWDIKLIQPALAVTEKGVLICRARNFNRRGGPGIAGVHKPDNRAFTLGHDQNHTNYNESEALYYWKHCLYHCFGQLKDRRQLVLERNGKFIKLNQLDYGCYPNIITMVDFMYVCFTEYNERKRPYSQITIVQVSMDLFEVRRESV